MRSSMPLIHDMTTNTEIAVQSEIVAFIHLQYLCYCNLGILFKARVTIIDGIIVNSLNIPEPSDPLSCLPKKDKVQT